MDKAGPFFVNENIYLPFYLPDYAGGGFSGTTGAVIGDFTTEVIKNGSVVTPTLYLTEIQNGHYHLSNQSGGNPWVETGPGDFYVHIYHGSTGTRRNFHFTVISGAKVESLNTQAKADVNAEADTALSDYDPPTKAEMDAGFSGLNDPTAGAIADQVWDEAIADHIASGSFGEAVQRILGLSLQNHKLTDLVFNADNLVTSGKIRLYETDALSNELFRYAFTASYDGDNNVSAFQVVKEA